MCIYYVFLIYIYIHTNIKIIEESEMLRSCLKNQGRCMKMQNYVDRNIPIVWINR